LSTANAVLISQNGGNDEIVDRSLDWLQPGGDALRLREVDRDSVYVAAYSLRRFVCSTLVAT